MQITPLTFRAGLERYEQQAQSLFEAFRSGDPEATRLVTECHPRFRHLSEPDVRNASFAIADAQLTVAHRYNFESWPRLVEYVHAVAQESSSVCQFESAVEAVITGDVATLESLLRDNSELIRARSTRPHEATLLHYVAANGVEGYRQKSPNNSVEVATMLLKAGAEVDALAEMYGGCYTTMSMLVSSCHPAEAGVQIALVETLLDFGAAIEGLGSVQWRSPLMTALAFGYGNTAEALARRGARVNNIAAAAGLGRLVEATQLLPSADGESRHRALALAAQHGHVDVVRLLLDAGEDPNRYNPDGNHSHSTPLHQAVWATHEGVVRFLVERGARLDIKDTAHEGTALDWAIYGERTEIEKHLRGQGAKTADELGQ
jgi:ankyrin repeat protein